jgi:hypothetical protein
MTTLKKTSSVKALGETKRESKAEFFSFWIASLLSATQPK